MGRGLSEPYGLFVVRPLHKTNDDDDAPHVQLFFDIGDGQERKCSINVKSSSPGEARLVYWAFPDFKHDMVSRLPTEMGFYEIDGRDQGPGGLALDYLRGGLVDLKAGQLVQYKVPGPDNDATEYVEEVVNAAIEKKATVYLWGERFGKTFRGRPSGDGIHQIHMNQGSGPPFDRENGVWQDGGFMVRFADGRLHAVFLAFASQASATKADGDAEPGAEKLATFVRDDDPDTERPPTRPTRPGGAVVIAGALINPEGRDGQPGATVREFVALRNTTDQTVSVAGWSITNRANGRFVLPAGAELGPRSRNNWTLGDSCPLTNGRGSITLFDAAGNRVHGVEYTKAQAKQEGEIIEFGA